MASEVQKLLPQLGHYTSSRGLLGIVEQEKLWATNIKFLNDENEFQHALNLIKGILQKGPTNKPREAIAAVFDEFQTQVTRNLGLLDPYRAESVFTLSFSEQIDLLSQWRGYCPDNNGYCVVFDVQELFRELKQKFADCHLVKCVYEDAEKAQRLKDLLNQRWWDYHALTDKKAKTTVIDSFSRELALLASYFKDPSFAEEEEHRIVIIDEHELLRQKVEFREGRSSLVPYLELSASRKLIKKIVIGPNPNQSLAAKALDAFIEKCYGVPIFVGVVEIVKSTTPYRRR